MMIVLGSGGHSAELLRCLLDAFSTTTPTMPSIDAEDDPQLLLRLINRVYIVADTDRLSASKADQLERSLTDSNKVAAMVRSIPRAREVGQPWMSSAFTFIRAQLHTTLVVWQERPQLIVCNGPGTCVPVCLCVRLFQVHCPHLNVPIPINTNARTHTCANSIC
jgi:beta-1,4-N-acetylglucosaminyltransferase